MRGMVRPRPCDALDSKATRRFCARVCSPLEAAAETLGSGFRSPRHPIWRTCYQVQDITLGISKKEHAAASASRFHLLSEFHTFVLQKVFGVLNGINTQRQVPPAVQPVVARFIRAVVPL